MNSTYQCFLICVMNVHPIDRVCFSLLVKSAHLNIVRTMDRIWQNGKSGEGVYDLYTLPSPLTMQIPRQNRGVSAQSRWILLSVVFECRSAGRRGTGMTEKEPRKRPCEFFKTCYIAQNNFTCLHGGGDYCGMFRELERKS